MLSCYFLAWSTLKLVEILNNLADYLHQNNFYQLNSHNQMFLVIFNSLSTSKCFVLFEVIFLLTLDNLALKSVCVTKFVCS